VCQADVIRCKMSSPGLIPRSATHRSIPSFETFARMSEDIDQETLARTHTKLQTDWPRSHSNSTWPTAQATKRMRWRRKLLNSRKPCGIGGLSPTLPQSAVCTKSGILNFTLDGVTFVPTMRKPFDVFAEGLNSEKSRGNEL
jgi:hypothetical protein